jgi:hypothetical protein
MKTNSSLIKIIEDRNYEPRIIASFLQKNMGACDIARHNMVTL